MAKLTFHAASLVLLLLFGSRAVAQKPGSITQPFTQQSRNYFSAKQIDSIFYAESSSVFEANRIPAALFEKKYPVLRSSIAALARQPIVRAFQQFESTDKTIGTVAPGSAAFNKNRQQYLNLLQKSIHDVFYNYKELNRYININGSDRITYFNSTVTVQPDGKLLVKEIISVYNGDGTASSVYGDEPLLKASGIMNNEIKRGIVRAFPLYYINRYRLFQNTTFVVKGVLRDGETENFHTEKKANGILLYTGSSASFLPKGNYKYTIIYETDHQLKMQKDFDELYWNATGNSWRFKIDSAICRIVLPAKAKYLSGKCYTGPQDSSATDCDMSSETMDDSTVMVTFRSRRSFAPNEGMTVSVSWPKGFVQAPSSLKQAGYLIWNNKAVFFLPIAALFSALFLFICWWFYGRDPDSGSIVASFHPPAGYSPAALGYITDHAFSGQLVAATIVDAAVRNIIKVRVEKEGMLFKHNVYTIQEPEEKEIQAGSEYEDFRSSVEDLIGTTIKKGKYNDDLGDLNDSLRAYCEGNYKSGKKTGKKTVAGFFALNNNFTTIPTLVCTAATVWALVWGLIPAIILKNYWQIAMFVAGIILCLIVFKIFDWLLPAYNKEGRALKDKIEGFKMYLSATDVQRMDMMNPPSQTLALYEKYLPFAIALDCEIAWGKQFKGIIETAMLDPNATHSFSHSMSRDSDNFSSSFTSSFSGTIASASSPPSSSSGGGSSFGGGSSGGGGGGGGGGGW